MRFFGTLAKQFSMGKAARFSMVLNMFEILLILAAFIGLSLHVFPEAINRVGVLLVVVGIVLAIQSVVSMRVAVVLLETRVQNTQMREIMEQMDELNLKLRKQRHDFMSHLQVVFSLVEMQQREETMEYIEDIYGQMRTLNTSMRTQKPAVNALIQAKLAVCAKKDIAAALSVTSDWKNIRVDDWELCRVLGNLIDNAMDAVEEVAERHIQIDIYEDLHGYGFVVANSGPLIPPPLWGRIFSAGYTTKQEGGGLGLSIVNDIMRKYGGEITLKSDAEKTAFIGYVPFVQPQDQEGQ